MKVDIFSDDWCDLVFEDKNKEYGAYKLRKLENKRILISMILASILFIGAFSFPLLLKAMNTGAKDKKTDITKFIAVILEPPKNLDDTKLIPETTTPIDKVRDQVKFTPPVIVKEGPETHLITQDSLALDPRTIGKRNITGNGTNPDLPLSNPRPPEIVPEPAPEPAVYVSQMPEFYGGVGELNDYLHKNIHYPDMAIQARITGTVNIQFVVESDGSITHIKLLRSIGGGCDEEAIRVISHMPKWKPGKQNGKAVAVYFMVPVKFSIN